MIKAYMYIPGVGKRELDTDEERVKDKTVIEIATNWFEETKDYSAIRVSIKNNAQIIIRGDAYKNTVFEFIDE